MENRAYMNLSFYHLLLIHISVLALEEDDEPQEEFPLQPTASKDLKDSQKKKVHKPRAPAELTKQVSEEESVQNIASDGMYLFPSFWF